jgi:hypothetical protein
VLGASPPPPDPEPPGFPAPEFLPKPPPVEVIVEKTEGEPAEPVPGKLPVPPPPTVIGIAVPELTVKDLQETNLKPPAPPPDP